MKRIAVICGGFSQEFEISLKSGKTIVDNFPQEYEAIKVILMRDSCYAEYQGIQVPFDLTTLTMHLPDKSVHLDYALIYTHGDPGENGKLQALFDIYGVKYLNSGALASELSFDKWFCNQFLKGFDVPVAKSKLLLKGEDISEEQLVRDLGLPLFVKPCDSGSSYGISRVNQQSELRNAIEFAFQASESVVIESFLDGTEVTCGVYRNAQGLRALPLAEIVSQNEFFDYDAKYNGQSDEIVPARVSDEVRIKVQELSKKIYQLLRLRSIARIDFMVVQNQPVLIEVNTTPGFSSASIVPQMLQVENIPITDFWREIMEGEFGI